MSIFRPARLLAVGTLAAVGLIIGAGVASAHVTVNPDTAVSGSYLKLTFRVPNESATASTVKLTVKFPVDHPFASVAFEKQPGWTAAVTTAKLTTPISDDDNATITQAVSSITWTADPSSKIALGQFAEFDVSVGPVPKVPSLAFDAIQTYDDGSVVNWDQPTPASGVEPEHPAPVLTVAESPSATPAVANDDGAARILAVVGIVVGAVALLVAAVALRARAKAAPVSPKAR